MFTRKFEWVVNHGDESLTGWLPVGKPQFDPVTGFGMAHDVLEHSCWDGTIAEEARAFGCMLYGRGAYGYWSRRVEGRQWADVVPEDVAEIICRYGPVPAASRVPVLDDDQERQISDMRAACPLYLDDYAEMWSYDTAAWNKDLDNFCDHLRIGYHAAANRWRNSGFTGLVSLFEEIESHPYAAPNSRTVDQINAGDKLVVQVDVYRSVMSIQYLPVYY